MTIMNENKKLEMLERANERERLELKKKEVALRAERDKKEKILELERQSLMLARKDRSFLTNVKQNVKEYVAKKKHKNKQKELKKKFGAQKLKIKISKEDLEISRLKSLLGKK